MEQTWRWYGPKDPVKLSDIRQAGATGIVTALHHVPIGEVWPYSEVLKRNREIESSGLTWSVVESIPVHEAIKTGKPQDLCQKYIENYKESIRNTVRAAGVKIFCYNFMPVVDWTRTDLDFVWSDGSKALKFDLSEFAAFDLFLLKRPNAEKDYTKEQIQLAKIRFEKMSSGQKTKLVNTITQGLPGRTSDIYNLESFKKALQAYEGLSEEQARDNMEHFIREISITAEQEGAYLAIHPDDPPCSLLGVPRMVSNHEDIKRILACYPSPHNGLTMCVGSYASNASNDINSMVKDNKKSINFVHLRNVRKDQNGGFVESDHLDGDVDMYEVMSVLLKEQEDRIRKGECKSRTRLPFRPDHGHQMLDDLNTSKKINPGYTGIGRLRGLAELRGLQVGIIRNKQLQHQEEK